MDIRAFFNNERGINDDTLAAFGVEFPELDVAHLPYTSGIKGRRHDDDGKRHFFFVEGNASGLFLSPDGEGADVCFLCEGESDGMRLWQELQGAGSTAMVAALSGINGWKAELAEFFDRFDTVYVVLDNDADYKVQSIVDQTWRSIRHDLGRRTVRMVLPSSPVPVKDVCEFFDAYDLSILREIAESVPDTPLFYKSLDLTKPAPPTDWLVKGFLAQGDTVIAAGEPTVGKSWLTLDLAVAVACGRASYLGKDVMRQGRVLYIDEENPEDIVLQRLERLGMDKENTGNIRFLHHQGVRFDKNPERIIDEAIAFSPTLTIVDSLSRVHAGDENSAAHVVALFNDGFGPLVRETGSTLLILHHVNKSDGSSAFGRLRGSSDLSGVIDQGYDIHKSGQHMHIKSFKSRRLVVGSLIVAEIVDTPDGGAEIQTRQRTVF
jgi:hypothetical protein